MASSGDRRVNSTGRYWIRRFSMPQRLSKRVQTQRNHFTDETYLPLMPKDLKKRKGKKIGELSKNQMCIVNITDRSHAVLLYTGNGKPSAEKVIDTLCCHIFEGAVIVDDGEKSYAVFYRT